MTLTCIMVTKHYLHLSVTYPADSLALFTNYNLLADVQQALKVENSNYNLTCDITTYGSNICPCTGSYINSIEWRK